MLTEQEREWLKARPWYPDNKTFRSMPDSRWYAVEFACRDWLHKYAIRHRIHWLSLLYYTADSESHFLRDAVEFEARVAKRLSIRIRDAYDEGLYDHDNGGKWGSIAPEPWDELKQARIEVEEEMDNAD